VVWELVSSTLRDFEETSIIPARILRTALSVYNPDDRVDAITMGRLLGLAATLVWLAEDTMHHRSDKSFPGNGEKASFSVGK